MAKVVIVDEQDKEVALKTYEELRYEDIYRVTTLRLTDLENNYCLVTQRKWTKHNDPGKWMMAVSGTVEEGEDYDKNMVVEIEEEIGLTGLTTKKEAKRFVDDGLHKFFVQYNSAQVDKDNTKITIQEEEVEQYKWIEVKKLLEWVSEKPEDFVPTMKEALKALRIL
jgi:isopentenyldiphosphate isomerase